MQIGKTEMSLCPGRHTMVTSKVKSPLSNSSTVPKASLTRNITSKSCDNGLQAFSSEFSMTSAITSVKQMRELFQSKHPEAQRLAGHLAKTTAIMGTLQGQGGEAYQLYQHPRMTAMGVRQ